jgi:hypothetical protein
LTDWFTVLGALLVGGLGGSGLTGIATTIYERHEMSKESKRRYISDLIMRPELFKYLTEVTEMYDFRRDFLELKQTGKVMIIVDGKPKMITSDDELLPRLSKSVVQQEETMKKFRESGAYFLLPNKLKTAINNLMYNLPSRYSTVKELDIEKCEELMDELRDCLRKELGIE